MMLSFLLPGRHDGLSLSKALPDRTLFFLVTMISFLAALTLTGANGARSLSERWQNGAAQLLTIQVPEPDQSVNNKLSTSRADTVVAALSKALPGSIVHRLTQAELNHLLTPWLGDIKDNALPLPGVIEVRLPDGSNPPDDLSKTLNDLVAGTSVERNTEWSERLKILAENLLTCATLALVAVTGVATMIIALTTRTGLSSRRNIIRILHSLGATDNYIAGRFASRTGLLALAGGFSGTLLSLIPLTILFRMAAPFTAPSATITDLPEWYELTAMFPSDLLTALAALPFVAALIGWFTTQTIVRLWLLRMP
ncbi:cell division protein FtsX [Acetobacter thailandicus]|nr:cell division protein FtsX [Acetobacter thailandicus]